MRDKAQTPGWLVALPIGCRVAMSSFRVDDRFRRAAARFVYRLQMATRLAAGALLQHLAHQHRHKVVRLSSQLVPPPQIQQQMYPSSLVLLAVGVEAMLHCVSVHLHLLLAWQLSVPAKTAARLLSRATVVPAGLVAACTWLVGKVHLVRVAVSSLRLRIPPVVSVGLFQLVRGMPRVVHLARYRSQAARPAAARAVPWSSPWARAAWATVRQCRCRPDRRVMVPLRAAACRSLPAAAAALAALFACRAGLAARRLAVVFRCQAARAARVRAALLRLLLRTRLRRVAACWRRRAHRRLVTVARFGCGAGLPLRALPAM